METITLKLTGMANGGAALGRDERGRVIFVPLAIPGERVRVEIVEDKGRYAQARLLEVLDAAPARTTPHCTHFGACGGCTFQHISYEAQPAFKQEIVRDQLQRLGGLSMVNVRPTLPAPAPWYYRIDVTFSPTETNRLGFWFPADGCVMPIEECRISRPALMELYADIDLELPGLRSLTLRQGDDDSLLMAMAIDGIDPPQLNTDMPVSAAMVLPDGQAANLVGDNFLVQRVRSKDFRVSAGCFFYPNPPMTEHLLDVVLSYADLSGKEQVVDVYTGVGVFSAFLAESAAGIVGIEVNPDAIADATLNLEETDNISLYEGSAEAVLPLLPPAPDLMIVDPPNAGLSKEVMSAILSSGVPRLIYVSGDVATLARDGRQLVKGGFALTEVQPLDMYPQTYSVLTVSLWERR